MNDKLKTITILGSTGSIGSQSLDVLESLGEEYTLGYITVNSKIDLLEEQVRKYKPIGVAIKDEKAYKAFKSATSFKGDILCGDEGVSCAAAYEANDVVLSALVGFAGVAPTLAAIDKGFTIALANKETLVSAGAVITNAAKAKGVDILAVDSEHSAVLQCLAGESANEIEKIILTASGGPFRTTPIEDFGKITITDALAHPNWSMGSKITIDSATMMNKGFEIIEAFWLFGVELSKIDVLVHPQSIVHSLVQFTDGSVKAQLGTPDMRIPISYALTYPNRMKFTFPRLDLATIANLSFFKPEPDKFRCLALAYKALEMGGAAPAILNAANEIAVKAFLDGRIKFTQIPEIIEDALVKMKNVQNPDLEYIIGIDSETRNRSEIFVNNLKNYIAS